MTKKVYALVSACVTAAGTVASAAVTFVQPAYAAAIVVGIGTAVCAVNEICALFIKSE